MTEPEEPGDGGPKPPGPRARRRRKAPAQGGPFFREEAAVVGVEVPILESLREKHSVVGEELRFLATRVLKLQRERSLKCVVLTSALPGEGKSTVATGLAAALAREPGRRVLLLEADLRRPSLCAALGVSPRVGLSEFLNGQVENMPLRDVVPGGFSLVVAGQAEIERPEVLGSPRMQAVLEAARERFDFVLVDSTPLLPVTDAVLMQEMVDGFLLVVRARQTPRDAVDEALSKLRPDRLVGLVLNDHQVHRHSYKAYGYQRYGMAYGR
jgi:capsular exopolysaccharide synthesis family protein